MNVGAGSELAGELGKICGRIEPVGGEQLGEGPPVSQRFACVKPSLTLELKKGKRRTMRVAYCSSEEAQDLSQAPAK